MSVMKMYSTFVQMFIC